MVSHDETDCSQAHEWSILLLCHLQKTAAWIQFVDSFDGLKSIVRISLHLNRDCIHCPSILVKCQLIVHERIMPKVSFEPGEAVEVLRS
eukprot:scaffold22599_cov139-Cylindrotheca_fusiformis.AAC.32